MTWKAVELAIIPLGPLPVCGIKANGQCQLMHLTCILLSEYTLKSFIKSLTGLKGFFFLIFSSVRIWSPLEIAISCNFELSWKIYRSEPAELTRFLVCRSQKNTWCENLCLHQQDAGKSMWLYSKLYIEDISFSHKSAYTPAGSQGI